MKVEWIINKLKNGGKEAKQEILEALENASANDLKELGCSALAHSMIMATLHIKRFGDVPMCEEENIQSDMDWDEKTDAQV